MVASKPSHSPFLDLPLEIREQVYGGLLSDPTCRNVQMLRTSQQIYAEAQPVLYRQPLAFVSQFDFYDWVKRSSAANLRVVQSIHLKLVDVIGHDGLEQSTIAVYRKHATSPIVQCYEADLARFSAALREVPNVRTLTLYKNRTAESDHFREFYGACFAAITQQFAGLRHLTFYVDLVPLDFLGSLRSLQSLRFTGFSLSSPPETLQTLQRLPQLEELHLFGPPPGISFQQRRGYAGPRTTHSMTAEVVQGLAPLKALTLCEIRDPLSNVPEFFLEESWLAALAASHARSLRSLRVSTDFCPSDESGDALAELIASSALLNIELGWPGLDGRWIELLPSSTRSLQITVSFTLEPDELARRLVARRADGRLAALRELVIRTDWREAAVAELAAKVDGAVETLRRAGIQTTKGTWYPIILDDVA
ncbi:MAG: hypothetical protein M1826_006802 [Phylliscum demangeonii]|nr:MAG: hypothetical protein M1826_006802 [Phylliscum demangeonii]